MHIGHVFCKLMQFLNKRSTFQKAHFCKYNKFNYSTSHSAYVATSTESNGAKIDGF